MSIKRTAIQVEADQIDLKIFRAIDQLEQLAGFRVEHVINTNNRFRVEDAQEQE